MLNSKITLIETLIFCFALCVGFAEKSDLARPQPSPVVRLSLLGYPPQASKVGVAIGINDTLLLKDVKGEVFGTFFPGNVGFWSPGEDSTRLIDFSSLTEEGRFAFYLGKKKVSEFFPVGKDPWGKLKIAALKAFYHNRASTATTEKYAGKWARAAGHPDTLVYFHESTGDTGTTSSPKGWYDAGDYGKYIVNSGITCLTLLELYEDYQDIFDTLSLNIPESNNSWPDLLDEVKWNLDWMLTMQAKDGGVYHKLTTLRFGGSIMPHEADAKRYIIGKSTAAALNFSAVMARASRLYRSFDSTFAEQTKLAAQRAYDWALAHPQKRYRQPSDVNTGEYANSELDDEFLMASAEMYMLVKDPKYLNNFDLNKGSMGVPSWLNVGALARFAFDQDVDESWGEVARKQILQQAEILYDLAQSSHHYLPMDVYDFRWGSNSEVANRGIFFLKAYRHTKEIKYLNAATRTLDYLLGMNPFNRSFVTGFGQRSAMHPHHRPSEADKIEQPVPGWVVGGPHPGGHDVNDMPWGCKNYVSSPAKSWVDWRCSYATNEVAINWNAPLAYLAFGVSLGWEQLENQMERSKKKGLF